MSRLTSLSPLALLLVVLLFGLLCFTGGIIAVLMLHGDPMGSEPAVIPAASAPASPAAAPSNPPLVQASAETPAPPPAGKQNGKDGAGEPPLPAQLAGPLAVPPLPSAESGAGSSAEAAAAVIRDNTRSTAAAAQGPAAYCIEVGIFHEAANATRLAEELRRQGFEPNLYSAPTDPAWITLSIGHYASAAAAEVDRQRLRDLTGRVGSVKLLMLLSGKSPAAN